MIRFLPLMAEEVSRRTFEWGRIQSNSDWILPIAVTTAVLLYVAYMYRRDAADLSPLLGVFLTVLRGAVFLALLVFFLEPRWRIETEKTINSRTVVAVDTSLSMGLTDFDSSVSTASVSRIQQTAAALKDSSLIDRLRSTHDVTVVRFDSQLHRDFLDFAKIKPKSAAAGDDAAGGGPTGGASADSDENSSEQGETKAKSPADVDWAKYLALSGEETRLGQSVQQLIAEVSRLPLSGVIVISDGGHNAGPGPEAIVAAAREAKVKVLTLGVGSDKQPPSVRVAAFNPPPRAYPGDPFNVTGVIQSWRMPGQTATVQLLARPVGSAADRRASRGTGELVESQQITLGQDGEEVPVKFTLTPEAVGKKTYCLKVLGPENDREKDDNVIEADVEIVDRKTKVLLFAGGPTREYQFVRNQLYRDKSVESDVLLQTAQPGVSQEAVKILDEFPSTREELYQYDCIVAFDPDWTALNQQQVDLLESWVAEQGGGLIVLAGPVFTGNRVRGWVEDASLSKIRALYPVEFPRRLSSLDVAAFKTDEPAPLEFTREGLEADFLTLTDSAVESRQAWEGFPGVYGCFPVRGAKQGATVLAHFGLQQEGEKPIFMAWQFYGSGRVLYMGSGEMWRLRAVDPTYFEQLYTKLIRHISKGRLLRGSTRGVLLVGQERYRLGNTVGVQAYRLTTPQLEPLELPDVTLQVILPDQTLQTVKLTADSGRPGSYSGQFTVLQEGEYRLELPLPGGDDESLAQQIRVEIPNLERERPERNDAVLSEIAQKTGGRYFVGLSALFDDVDQIVSQFEDRTRTLIFTETPSAQWQQQWLLWLLLGLFGFLCVEWIVRRLAKLA